MDRLPPLTALRAFDAAARHMSFQAAAQELAVTPAALSFQIKSLEEHLGAPLFVRLNRAVALTEAGKALAPGAADGFASLRQAWARAQAALRTNRLTVTAGPALTAKWLAPRLADFARTHPDIELRFVTTTAILDFARDGIDLAIRFGEPRENEGLFSEFLMDERVTPYARPDTAARLSSPGDLLGETLIYDDSLAFISPPLDWSAWFAKAGVPGVPSAGPHFNQADNAMDLAIQGGGVVLGRQSLAVQSLKTGALVAPFPIALTMQALYRCVCPMGEEDRPAIKTFRRWVRDEVTKDEAILAAQAAQAGQTAP